MLLEDSSNNNREGLIKDQRVWSPAECAQVMAVSVKILYERFKVFHSTVYNHIVYV